MLDSNPCTCAQVVYLIIIIITLALDSALPILGWENGDQTEASWQDIVIYMSETGLELQAGDVRSSSSTVALLEEFNW